MICFFLAPAPAADNVEIPLVRVADLGVGETQTVVLSDRTNAIVKLLEVNELRDPLRDAIREAQVRVEVDGNPATLSCGNYHLPVTVERVQIDCTVTAGYRLNNRGERDPWGLDKDARVRLWPAEYPFTKPHTFVYPVKQRWFASATQMSNEPVFVDGGEIPSQRSIYYHSGLDIGGAEALVTVVAAADALVVAVGEQVLEGHEKEPPVDPRYDVIYLFDDRGWYHRYSHLYSFDDGIELGARVQAGQKLGMLGKEGGSGGWSHLHFELKSRQPSGKWGTQEGYAFLWDTYLREYKPDVIAVARPHHFISAGETVVLDGRRSWSRHGKISRYQWTFTDGRQATSAKVEQTYQQPGSYSEILEVRDEHGNVAYDFAVVQVVPKGATGPEQVPPTIHAAYFPASGIFPGDSIDFKVRTFRTTDGEETWDFGDGSPRVTVRSDGNVVKLDPRGYAVTSHSYRKPGDYIVRVERTNKRDETAIAHLHVRVEKRGR